MNQLRPPSGPESRARSSGLLVQSGPLTREWLRKLREALPRFKYQESAYYASFRTVATRGAFAYLNPAKNSIRLFVCLDPSDDTHLSHTPSTHQWADRFPSIFTVRSEGDLAVARALIEESYVRAGGAR
jgi:hypothetical protein